MSNIAKAFDHGKAFIPFITCGDPSLEVTEKLVLEMADAGADLIELGIPFSDPTAEGPVIRNANLRALSGGVTVSEIFEMVKRLRQSVKVPMVFMTYANVVFSCGLKSDSLNTNVFKSEPQNGNSEIFISKCSEIGIDALILPDIPFEEKEEFDGLCKKYGLDLISMIAPTSHERISMIAEKADGFLYCVSSLGVTGTRSSITTDINSMIRLVKKSKDIPCAVGFGISTPKQAAEMAAMSDGVIVGSAIVMLCEKYGAGCVPYVADYVRSMKQAILSVH